MTLLNGEWKFKFYECDFKEEYKEKLEKAQHCDEFVKDDFVTVRNDYKNSGIGSNSCGPQLLEKYRLDEKDIHFVFYIS